MVHVRVRVRITGKERARANGFGPGSVVRAPLERIAAHAPGSPSQLDRVVRILRAKFGGRAGMLREAFRAWDTSGVRGGRARWE